MTINHLAQVAPHAPAITIDGRGTLDREQLDQLSARLANALRARGLGLGNRVALLMDNSLAFAISAWAARRSGLRAVPINWQLKPSEVAYVIEDSDARALIASTRFAELVGEMETSTSGLVKLADPEPFADFTALNRAIAEQEPIEPSGLPDGAPMYYSSGTTGKPKGICRDTGLAFGEQRPIEHLYARLYELRPGSVVLIPAPLYFAAPFGWMMAATALGCHVCKRTVS